MKLKLLACTALIILAGCSKSDIVPETKVDYLTAQMRPAQSPNEIGMVASANPHANQDGVEALRHGGSAVDAAIGVQSVLGLVEPQSSGIGGGAFMIFYDAKSGKTTFYNGREKAPKAATERLFLDENGEPLRFVERVNSGISTGVPGAISMLHMAHNDHGKRPWSEGFVAATKLAEAGFSISPRLAYVIGMGEKYGLKESPSARAYFYDAAGNPLPEGHILKNQPYANSLKLIALDYRNLYRGKLAQEIVDMVGQAPRPGSLTLEDLKTYQPDKREALCSPYRDRILCGGHPPTSGGIAVQSIMGQLQSFDMKALGPTVDGWHVFADASAQAYADRDLFVGDPDFVDVPTRAMLNADYLNSRAGNINMEHAIADVQAGDPVNFKPGKDATPDVPGTTHFSIVDKWGNVVSMTTTVEGLFGSKRMAGGFILNNQLTDFSARIRDKDGKLIANRPEGGKRPRSSMAPHIVFTKDGQFDFATGSPGGSSIIAYTAKTIVAMLDWGMSPQDAAGLANVISRNGAVRIEESKLSEDIIEGLEARGHKVVRSSGEMSGIHIVRRRADGSYEGGADPRREGTAESE